MIQQRKNSVPAFDTSLVPNHNGDLANAVLNDDVVHAVDISATALGFVATIIQVRADGDFQWSTGADPVQGTGPWLDGGSLWSIPVSGATTLKLIRRTNAGATVNVFAKALGAD